MWQSPDEDEEVVDVKGHQPPWHIRIAVVDDGFPADLGAKELGSVADWGLGPPPDRSESSHGRERGNEGEEGDEAVDCEIHG